MINDQVAQEVFYGIPQPGFKSKIEAIKTILENYKIQIIIDGQELQEAPEFYIPGSFIFIGVRK